MISPVHATASQATRVTAGQAFKQLVKNTGRIASNTGQIMMQNHAGLARNSLVLSSLALVISRTIIAHLSAHQAKGTEEGPYRYREAVRTTLREWLGWFFSFGVLRVIETLSRLGIRKYFGIQTNDPKSAFKQWWEAAGNALRRIKHDVPPLGRDPAQLHELKFLRQDRFDRIKNTLLKFPAMRNLPDNEMVRAVSRWAPLLIGVIPTILLAGYVLERFTRDYSDDVVNFLSRRKGHKGQTQQPPAEQPSSDYGFSNYLANFERRQMNRGVNAFAQPSPFNPMK